MLSFCKRYIGVSSLFGLIYKPLISIYQQRLFQNNLLWIFHFLLQKLNFLLISLTQSRPLCWKFSLQISTCLFLFLHLLNMFFFLSRNILIYLFLMVLFCLLNKAQFITHLLLEDFELFLMLWFSALWIQLPFLHNSNDLLFKLNILLF